jgi:hypothetical protein
MDATLSPDFSAGKLRILYSALMKVSPDGQRFLAIQSVVPDQPPTMSTSSSTQNEHIPTTVVLSCC